MNNVLYPLGLVISFSATKSKESVEVPPAEGEMSVLVTIDKPEIILIEDQSNFCSNALILDVS